MSKQKIVINRVKETATQTKAGLFVLKEKGWIEFEAAALELPFRDNARNISRIPPGKYTAVRRFSPKYSNHLHIQNTEPRTLILIHHGNFNRDTRGCILIGSEFRDIDKDGCLDVVNSIITMERFMSVLVGQSFEVETNDCF